MPALASSEVHFVEGLGPCGDCVAPCDTCDGTSSGKPRRSSGWSRVPRQEDGHNDLITFQLPSIFMRTNLEGGKGFRFVAPST